MSDINNKEVFFGESPIGGTNDETSYFESGSFNANGGNGVNIGNNENIGINENVENNGGISETSYFEGTIGNEVNGETQNNDGGAYNGTIQEFNIVNAGNNVTSGTTGETALAKQSLWYKIKSFFLLDVNLSATVGGSINQVENKEEKKSFFKGFTGLFK